MLPDIVGGEKVLGDQEQRRRRRLYGTLDLLVPTLARFDTVVAPEVHQPTVLK